MQIKKSTIIVTITLLATIIVLTAFIVRPQGKVEFALAPEEATVSIDGRAQAIRNKQVITLSPGKYTLKVTRDHFSTESVAVTVKKNETVRTVVALDPQTDTARKVINDNPDSVKIAREYKEIKQAQLFKSLPLSGVNYMVESCKSIKHPKTSKKALCITSPTDAGEATAKLAILQLGYNMDEFEVLSGKSSLKTFIKTDTYKIEAYQDDPSEHPEIYITPLNVPYVPPDAPRNEQLEVIRTTSLAELEKRGYNHDNYIVVFSNMYLTRYNLDILMHGEGSGSSLD